MGGNLTVMDFENFRSFFVLTATNDNCHNWIAI